MAHQSATVRTMLRTLNIPDRCLGQASWSSKYLKRGLQGFICCHQQNGHSYHTGFLNSHKRRYIPSHSFGKVTASSYVCTSHDGLCLIHDTNHSKWQLKKIPYTSFMSTLNCTQRPLNTSTQQSKHLSKSLMLLQEKQNGRSLININQNVAALHQGAKPAEEKHFVLSPSGILLAMPEYMHPYLRLMRFDRPIGTWLLFLPCAFSISLAAPAGHLPDPTMLALFALGSFFMRGAGCTINDMWDKDFDARVERTKDRPLACGQVSYFQALCFLGIQLSASLAILLTFNWNTIALGAFALVPCIIYPLMKRITYWPQAFLGLTFNYGALMGWCAVHGSIALGTILPLYMAGVAWTLVYDTIYGHQDKDDDILIGVKSTALKFGDQTKPLLAGFSGVMLSGLTVSGMMCDQTWPYFLGVGAVGAHLIHQIWTVNLNNPEDCGKKFRSNRNLGLLLWATIVAGNLLRSKQEDKDKEEESTANSTVTL